MKSFLKQLLSSKKFLATITAVLVWLVGRAGFHLDQADLLPVIGSLAAFVVGQGFADKGKEAVKEELKAYEAGINPTQAG